MLFIKKENYKMILRQNNKMQNRLVLLFLAVGIFILSAIDVSAEILSDKAFVSPPAFARPWVYWYWYNGNISAEGIRADISAMKASGIGGVMLFDVGYQPQGPVENRSRQWYDLVHLAVSEAAANNIKVSLHCPGWEASGGPWITPELGMQELVWSETNLTGPQTFSGKISMPFSRLGSYHDVAVLAFPAIANDVSLKELKPAFKKNTGEILSGIENIIDGNPDTFATLPGQFEIVFEKPVELRSIYLSTAWKHWAWSVRLEAFDEKSSRFVLVSDKLRSYYSGYVGSFVGGTSFPAAKAKRFRLTFPNKEQAIIQELDLGGSFRLQHWTAKAGFNCEYIPAGTSEEKAGVKDIIPLDQIIDLSSQITKDGKLNWEVPDGNWILLRIGYTPRGVKVNVPAWGGSGLECDKLSREAVDFHYDHCVKPILKELGSDLVNKAVTYYHVDSFEAGGQNWTEKFAEEFKARRGYDMIKYLPAVTGRVIGDQNMTERFLWDFRRTIGDLFAQNHSARLTERAHEDGLLFSVEPYGGTFEDLQIGGHADCPMVEFWEPGDVSGGKMLFGGVSSAHTYGHQVVRAEAFTSSALPNGRWNEYPFAIKSLGDLVYCSGVNLFSISIFSHQPWIDEHLRPGITCGPYGMHFDRGNTWWYQGKAWVTYLTRCQYLLQQGKSVAQALYYHGCDVPSTDLGIPTLPRGDFKPEMPDGFDFDVCNKEILLCAKVKNGNIVLPSGASYRYLVLPSDGRLTMDALFKIKELVESGATVIGSVPNESPSLADYPKCIGMINKITKTLWGEGAYGIKKTGKGRVIWGMDFASILKNDKLTPDFDYDVNAGLKLHYTHRQTQREDIYFVANAGQESGWAVCKFKVSGRTPQFWYPDGGLIEECAVFEKNADTVSIPIRFDPCGSVFVVFRSKNLVDNQITIVTRDGLNAFEKSGSEKEDNLLPNIELSGKQNSMIQARVWKNGKYEMKRKNGQSVAFEVNSIPKPLSVTGIWKVRFPAGWNVPDEIELSKLISWTEYSDPGVRYFSGTATYNTIINLPSEIMEHGKSIYLDLGEVDVFAELKVNGHDFGILWKPPFRVNITTAIKVGENRIEIKVTNLWPNRLIGDEQYQADVQYEKIFLPYDNGLGITAWPGWLAKGSKRSEPHRLTFTTLKAWSKDEPLLPSGLIGPVRILTAEDKQIR
jgi:hypothetical protein